MGLPVLLLLVTLLIAAPPPAAQQADGLPARYGAVVEAYRAGAADAAQEAATWPREELTRAPALAAGRGPRFAEAAALLHLRVASNTAASDWARGSAHLDTASALVQSLPPEEERFAERYYAVVATLFLAHGDVDGARAWVERGLQLFEFSAPIRTASGMVEELFAHRADPECAGLGCPAGAGRTLVPERLRQAAREYELALQRDPALAEARLRRGRVLSLLERDEEAIADLEPVVSSGTPRQQYLAHLFRGAIAVRRRDAATARQSYEAARALAPGRQTPLLALSHLDESLGDVAAARRLLAPLAAAAPAAGDPWWSYQNGGLDEETLAWLHDYVRQ
ncbi:MAG: tetratricopeptide repeat protein [Vicinamibacterales bacterium]